LSKDYCKVSKHGEQDAGNRVTEFWISTAFLRQRLECNIAVRTAGSASAGTRDKLVDAVMLNMAAVTFSREHEIEDSELLSSGRHLILIQVKDGRLEAQAREDQAIPTRR
jgi:hypothetical protein